MNVPSDLSLPSQTAAPIEETNRRIVEVAQCLFASDTATLFQAQTGERGWRWEPVVGAAPPDAWLGRLLQLAEAEEVALLEQIAAHPEWESEFARRHEITSAAALAIRPAPRESYSYLLYLDARRGRTLSCTAQDLKDFAAQASAISFNRWVLHHIDELQVEREQHTARMLKSLTDWLRNLTDADIVALYPYVEQNKRFDDKPYHSGEIREVAYRPGYFRGDDIASLTANQAEIVFAEDSGKLYESLGGRGTRRGDFEKRERIASTVAIPLRVKPAAEVVGTMFLNYRTPQQFPTARRARIALLATLVAQAITDSRALSREALHNARSLEKLHEIEQQLLGTAGLEQALARVLELAKEHLSHANDASLLLHNSESSELVTLVAFGQTAEQRKNTSRKLREGQGAGLISWACLNQIPARIGNVRGQPWADHYRKVSATTISELDVPLLDGAAVLGALNFESDRPDAFNKEDQSFLVDLAGRIVRAIKNHEEQIAIREIEREIVSELDFQKVVEKILDHALQLTRADYALIALRDERTGETYTINERGVERPFHSVHIPAGQGIISEVYRLEDSLLVDLSDPQWKYLYFPTIDGMGWQLTVPIVMKDKVRGAVVIESRPANRLTWREERLMDQLADHIAIALENAERYAKTEKMRDRLDRLREVDLKIIEQAGNYDAVMQQIVEAALHLTAAEIGDLQVYQGDAATTERYFASVTPYEDPWWSDRGKLGIIEHVARTRAPYLMKKREDDPYYKGNDKVNSEVAVPLIARNGAAEEFVGVLNLESREPAAFSEDDVEVLAALAGQAVIAILNARTYARAVEEARRFEVLLDVGRGLSEILDLRELGQAYEAVIRGAARFTDGLIVVRRFDATDQTLAVVAQGGNTPKRVPETRWPIEQGLNGYVARTGKMIWVADVHLPPEGLPPASLLLPEVRSLVVAPIKFIGQTGQGFYGTLSLSHEQVGHFRERDVKLIEGLAERLAITIHRLETVFEQQQTEQRLLEAEVMSSIGQAAAEWGHRLGNDLGPVRTLIDEVKDALGAQGHLSADVERDLNTIRLNIGKTLVLNQQYKQVAQEITAEKSVKTLRQRVIVRELLEDICRVLPSLPPTIKLHQRIDGEVPAIHVVAENIQNIVSNLVQNAIEAMPAGGEIHLTARHTGRDVVLEISDTGSGIDPRVLPHIFDLNFSTKGSTGFGLWSAKRYALANGGDLTVESRPGKGAVFSLHLPKHEEAPNPL